MTTGTMMGYPNTSAAVQKTDGGILYDHTSGSIYGLGLTSGSGANGWRKWTEWPSGDEVRARNLADLGITQVGPVLCLISTARQIVMCPGTSNSQGLSAFSMDDMTVQPGFGITSASLAASTTNRILASASLVSFLDGLGRDVVVATPIFSGAGSGGAEINCIWWGAKINQRSNIAENYARLGAVPDGSGNSAWALGFSGGATPMTLYKIAASKEVSTALVTAVGTITVANIDPTWTTVGTVYGVVVDQKDGNVIAGFSTLDSVTNPAYLVKLSATTGAIMWKIAVGTGINHHTPADMARSHVKNGKLYYLGNTSKLYVIDTIAGTFDNSITVSSGGTDPLHGVQISEDYSGSVMWYGSWSEVNLHPNYVGTFAGIDGNHSGSAMVWRFWPTAFTPPAPAPQVFSRKRAWSFTLDGHTFYVLDLGAQGTYLYDKDTGQWCQFVTDGYVAWNFANGCLWGQRIVAGDMLTTDLWEMNPGALFDNGAAEIVHVVTGGVATRSRIYHSVDAFRLSCSVGQVLDGAGADVTLSFSDDQGQTWTTMDTINLPEGNFSQEIAWNGLGAFSSPGRIFKITDSGGFLRIEGADAGIDGFDPTDTAGG